MTLLVFSLSMLGTSTIQAQDVQDSSMCYDYGTSTLEPIGEGNTIFQYTEKIGLWVKIQNPGSSAYRVVWEDPAGIQFRNSAVTVIDKSGEDWGIIFDSINIAESTAKNKLGVWTVLLYIDGEVGRAEEFQIIDYESIQEQVNDLIEDYTGLVDSLDELQAEKDAIEASYEVLQAQYDALEEQIGTQSEYEALQDNYDELLDDYESLKANQTNTKTMLYASIIVALVAVVVAVYFGVLRK